MSNNQLIVHLGNLEKFMGPFVDLIGAEFDSSNHYFWLSGTGSEDFPVNKSENVFILKKGKLEKLKGYLILVLKMHGAGKIILHGLSNSYIAFIMIIFPWLLKRSYWVIWGGDLYKFEKPRSGLKEKVKELIRHILIKRIDNLITYIHGDVELARQWYGAKGTHHECIMYLSNVVDPKTTADSGITSDHDGLNILLGNSADPSNNHIEVLERLLPFKEKDIKIYSPLSYGDPDHAEKVIRQGKKWFGDKFVPLTDFVPFEQYLEFLKSLDIAIFNHQRQQAMGNTITLLGMGKTVFMRSDVSHWRFLKSLGIKLNDVADIRLCRIAPSEAKENRRVVRSYFSKATLIKQLSDIFEE